MPCLQYLHTDGTIQYEAKLTGILSTSILSEGEGPLPEHGTLMSPGLNAQIHQHFFCVRMDPAVDCEEGGKALTVSEASPQPFFLTVKQCMYCNDDLAKISSGDSMFWPGPAQVL